MRHRWRIVGTLVILGMLALPGGVWAQEQVTVSAEDFRKLKEGYDQLKQEVQQLREVVAKRGVVAPPAEAEYVTVEEFEQLKEEVGGTRPGLSNFVLTGYSFAGYTDAQGSDSNFTAGFNPIFLWELNDRLLFEGELEVELEDDATMVDLEYAHLTYLLNDYMTLGAGKFLSPFGIFRERLHPAWINKLPDAPLGYTSGANRLAPPTQLGVQVRGAVPLPLESKANYAFWVSNGPELQTGATNAGQLAFKNVDDSNNNKALGWRFSFLPIPETELGYSVQIARVGASGTAFNEVDTVLQGLDFSYVRDSELLKGALDLRSEWIWSHVEKIDYGTSGGAFRNDRWAGYVQAAYRPKVGGRIVEKFEPVIRFDMINHPKVAPSNQDEERWTLGLDYHLASSTVLKTAYRIDERRGAEDVHAFLWQVAMGF